MGNTLAVFCGLYWTDTLNEEWMDDDLSRNPNISQAAMKQVRRFAPSVRTSTSSKQAKIDLLLKSRPNPNIRRPSWREKFYSKDKIWVGKGKRKVLLCMDGSDHAFKAFKFYLKYMHNEENDEIQFLHVPTMDPRTNTENEEAMAAQRLCMDRFVARTQDRCDKMCQEHRITADFKETEVAYPSFEVEFIDAYIRQWCPHMIVAGQRGYDGVKGLQLGSVVAEGLQLGSVVAGVQRLASDYNIPMRVVPAMESVVLSSSDTDYTSTDIASF